MTSGRNPALRKSKHAVLKRLETELGFWDRILLYAVMSQKVRYKGPDQNRSLTKTEYSEISFGAQFSNSGFTKKPILSADRPICSSSLHVSRLD